MIENWDRFTCIESTVRKLGKMKTGQNNTNPTKKSNIYLWIFRSLKIYVNFRLFLLISLNMNTSKKIICVAMNPQIFFIIKFYIEVEQMKFKNYFSLRIMPYKDVLSNLQIWQLENDNLFRIFSSLKKFRQHINKFPLHIYK